jgi:hypothetical protein
MKEPIVVFVGRLLVKRLQPSSHSLTSIANNAAEAYFSASCNNVVLGKLILA